MEGQLLDGRFRTVAPLNHGSFGQVFLAEDTKSGEQVAIKCLTKPDPANPDTAALSLSEELDFHSRLGYHPNIVNMIHSFETGAHIFLVLEYCSMGDLYEAIRSNRGPLETEHVREFMLQLVSSIEFMHDKGLYHRDIKPENIFLTSDGSMKLGDFGLATLNSWSHEACVGSDRYMAPEQYDPPANGYSPAKADIWSIGVCLLNILFSRNPFAVPAESDVLFSDYTRDRQSLFDVFPNMSQGTFEILINAMTLDPEKRSLSGVRHAILRAVSFTTDDESLDEFCTEDRDFVPASANREPLRTPSIQSPQINQGDSFPWAKALQSTPQQAVRQLSIIPDTESYTEDLFPPSDIEATSWYSGQPETPSMASVLDSVMGGSFKDMAIRPPPSRYPPPSDPVPMPGSLPTHASRPSRAMSMVFGKDKSDDIFSKSWSDLWDEEESENEDLALQQRREQNARSWSQESKEEASPVPSHGLSEMKSSSTINARAQSPKPTSAVPTDIPAPAKPRNALDENHTAFANNFNPGRHSPTKKTSLDKWAALGNKRRNFKPDDPSRPRLRQSTSMNWRRPRRPSSPGRENAKDASVINDRPHNPFLDKDWRREQPKAERFKPTKYPLGGGYDGIDDDMDWVGGWHDLHL